MEFFQEVSRIMTAVCLGQASLRAHFGDPAGFAINSYQSNGVRRSIEACYRLLLCQEPANWSQSEIAAHMSKL